MQLSTSSEFNIFLLIDQNYEHEKYFFCIFGETSDIKQGKGTFMRVPYNISYPNKIAV